MSLSTTNNKEYVEDMFYKLVET